MIKFFRAIRKDLMEKNKTGKYLKYAIGEIILVVIGILIALQVSNWNERKKIDQSTKDHLAILKENLKEDQIQLNELRTTMEANVNYADSSMRQIRTEIPVDKYLKKYLTLLIREFDFRPNKNAIETITQSNEIPSLSEKLRTAILDYYSLIESANERESISNNNIQLRYEAYIINEYPIIFQKDNPWDYVQEIYKKDPREPIPIDTQQFLSDRILEALLISRYYQCTQLKDFYAILEQSTINLVNLIDQELK
jgi:hypothetical protein